jgi:hypothetical protein
MAAKLVGYFRDLIALGLSRRQIDAGIADGSLKILSRSPRAGVRRFDMRSAYKLAGLVPDDGLIALADLQVHLDAEVIKRVDLAIQTRLRAVLSSALREELAKSYPYLANPPASQTPGYPPRSAPSSGQVHSSSQREWATRGGGSY